MLKALYLIAVSSLALGAAACQPPAKTLTRLDCPATQGNLTRVGAAADGRSCAYVSENGAEVSLRVVEVKGGLQATLANLEQELRSFAPPKRPAAAASAEPDPAKATVGAASPDAEAAAAKASAEARADAGGRFSVEISKDEDAGSDGGVVRVDIPGIHIEADEANEQASVRIGGMEIDADERSSTFRQVRDVRLRGESLSRQRRGVRARLVLAGEQVEPTYSYVEYEAGGRKTGPLAVALVRSKAGDPMGHDHGDVERLVRRNGGV